MAKTKRTRIKRRATLRRKKIRGGQALNPKISTKIDVLLILLTKKLKQDQNNKEFYISCFESILKDIHNIKRSNSELRGGGNLKLSLTKLFILLLTLKTGLSSQMVVHNSHLVEFKKEIRESRDVHDIAVVPTFDKYLFYSEPDNVANFKVNNRILAAVDSLNKHYTTMISGKTSELSSASKITNLCRDVFLGSDVQKFLLSPKTETSSILSSSGLSGLMFTNTPTETNDIDNTPTVDFNSICELGFPIPRLFIDDDQILKVEVTKSISYNKIADMLETLYNNAELNKKLDSDIKIKITKLRYLIKGVRYIEDSSREYTDFESKIHNVHKRITEYFSTFEEIENLFGDPQLHFDSIKKGLTDAFDIRLSEQETAQNEMKVRSHMNSYILPFFSGVSSVSESSIEYFTDSVNSIISGFNIDFHFYNLLLIAMGTIVSCVAVKTCLKKKTSSSMRDKSSSKSTSNSTSNSNNDIEELKKQIQMLIEHNKDRVEAQISMHSRQERIEEQLRQHAMLSNQQRAEELILQHTMYARQKRIDDQLQQQTYTRQQLIDDQSSRMLPLPMLRIENQEQIGIENQERISRLQSRIKRLKCPDGERRNKKTGECEKKY